MTWIYLVVFLRVEENHREKHQKCRLWNHTEEKQMIKYYNTQQNPKENMNQHNDQGTMNFASKDYGIPSCCQFWTIFWFSNHIPISRNQLWAEPGIQSLWFLSFFLCKLSKEAHHYFGYATSKFLDTKKQLSKGRNQ